MAATHIDISLSHKFILVWITHSLSTLVRCTSNPPIAAGQLICGSLHSDHLHHRFVIYNAATNPTTKYSKMKTTTIALASSLAFTQTVLADYGWQFGNAFSTGPVATNSFIRESNTTLVLPEVNSPQTGNLALWPGMGTSGGDLIQALAISVADGR